MRHSGNMALFTGCQTPVKNMVHWRKSGSGRTWLLLTILALALQVCQVHGTTKEQTIIQGQSWSSRPFEQRPREQLDQALSSSHILTQEEEDATLTRLRKIYQEAIRPLADAYKYSDIDENLMTDGDITCLTRILFLGPWSTGKSSIINYLLDIENSSISVPSGATPTTTDFTVLQYGTESQATDGPILALDETYSPLRKFGHNFLQKLRAQRLPSKLLKKVTVVDTPGIIENQKQQERGYPFREVCQWFIQRADMIFLVFDPTKLDVGSELEKLFKQLKGFESKVYIVLNKADTVPMQELLRVYSALFWNLSPLINVTEPPRVYLGSFWSKAFSPEANEYKSLFEEEELSLFTKMDQTIRSHLQLRAAALHRQATKVRNHALIVDQFHKTLKQHKSFFKDTNEIQDEIINHPEDFKILQSVLAQKDVCVHDVMPMNSYRDFFAIHPMESFKPLENHCPYFGSCFLDEIQKAIKIDLPALIEHLELKGSKSQGHCVRKDGVIDCEAKYKAKSNYSP